MWIPLILSLFLGTARSAPVNLGASCETILSEIERIESETFRDNTFLAMLQITVKPASELGVTAELRETLRSPEVRRFATAGRVSDFDHLPLGFQILWFKLWEYHSQPRDRYWSIPQVWRTPEHWYEMIPGLFPPEHREIDKIGSRTQVLVALDRNLWQVVGANLDLIEDVGLYTTPRKFSAVLTRRRQRASRHECFQLGLQDVKGSVVAKFEVRGRSADAALAEIHCLPVPAGRWADWDSSGEKIDGVWTMNLANLAEDLTRDEIDQWIGWIKKALKGQYLRVRRVPE